MPDERMASSPLIPVLTGSSSAIYDAFMVDGANPFAAAVQPVRAVRAEPFCRRSLFTDLEVVPPDHVVAFTGGLLEPLASATVTRRPSTLRIPAFSKMATVTLTIGRLVPNNCARNSFVTKKWSPSTRSRRGQNPARAPLLQAVQSVARGRSHRGNQERVRVFRQNVSKGPVLFELPVEVPDGELQRRAFVDGDGLARHAPRADTRRNPRRTFAADRRGLDAVAVRHQRQKRARESYPQESRCNPAVHSACR